MIFSPTLRVQIDEEERFFSLLLLVRLDSGSQFRHVCLFPAFY